MSTVDETCDNNAWRKIPTLFAAWRFRGICHSVDRSGHHHWRYQADAHRTRRAGQRLVYLTLIIDVNYCCIKYVYLLFHYRCSSCAHNLHQPQRGLGTDESIAGRNSRSTVAQHWWTFDQANGQHLLATTITSRCWSWGWLDHHCAGHADRDDATAAFE